MQHSDVSAIEFVDEGICEDGRSRVSFKVSGVDSGAFLIRIIEAAFRLGIIRGEMNGTSNLESEGGSEILDLKAFEREVSAVASSVYGPNWRTTHLERVAKLLREFGLAMKRFSNSGEVAIVPAVVGSERPIGFPLIWDLLRFLLGRANRERVFFPAYNDLLSDHLLSQLPKYSSTWSRRWIKLCFAIRTFGLVLQCMAVGVRAAIAAALLPLVLRQHVERILNWITNAD